MRIVTLSDHAAEQIQKAQDMRTTVNDRMRADWQAAVDRREAEIADHAGALRQAWAKRRVIAVIVIFFNWLMARLSSKPALPTLLEAGADEGRFQGGQEGETRVVASLSRLFDDQWVAFRGYFNRGGETDILLVGPTAIVAVEVKFLNGEVHCEGQAWSRDKRDRYGNVVERGLPVRDGKGRSPGQQVNATADGLQAQLARRGFALPVRRAVILAHPASRLGRVNEPGVEFIGVLADSSFQSQFLALVQPPAGRKDLDVAALEALVRRDHEYHVGLKARRAAQGTVAATAAPAMPAPGPATAAVGRATAGASDPALTPPRPVKLLPPGLEGHVPPSDLEQRQARALFADLSALSRSKGTGAELERRIRKAISGHLQNGGRYRVLSMTVPVPGNDDERLLLNRLIAECRQTVELEDRTLHAIVVPLAVRWEAPEGADWSAVWIDSVRRGDLDTPAGDFQRGLEVETIVFSNRLYEGGRLQSLDPRLLRQALVQLDSGAEPDMPELKPARVSPTACADWQIFYLLGVAVTALDEPLLLDDEARRTLAGRYEIIASAFTMAALEATGTPDAAWAVAEDLWTLAEGVQHGRRLQCRHVLETVLSGGHMQGDAGGAPLRCWYASDMADLRLHLLIDWGPVRSEREFRMHGEEQPVQAFRAMLDAAIAARVPPGTAISVEQLDLHDYRKQARAIGMSWIGQTQDERKPRQGNSDAGRGNPASSGTSAIPPTRGPRH